MYCHEEKAGELGLVGGCARSARDLLLVNQSMDTALNGLETAVLAALAD